MLMVLKFEKMTGSGAATADDGAADDGAAVKAEFAEYRRKQHRHCRDTLAAALAALDAQRRTQDAIAATLGIKTVAALAATAAGDNGGRGGRGAG